jgi:hypothetical protein
VRKPEAAVVVLNDDEVMQVTWDALETIDSIGSTRLYGWRSRGRLARYREFP